MVTNDLDYAAPQFTYVESVGRDVKDYFHSKPDTAITKGYCNSLPCTRSKLVVSYNHHEKWSCPMSE